MSAGFIPLPEIRHGSIIFCLIRNKFDLGQRLAAKEGLTFSRT